jgi:hypothetical protein
MGGAFGGIGGASRGSGGVISGSMVGASFSVGNLFFSFTSGFSCFVFVSVVRVFGASFSCCFWKVRRKGCVSEINDKLCCFYARGNARQLFFVIQ